MDVATAVVRPAFDTMVMAPVCEPNRDHSDNVREIVNQPERGEWTSFVDDVHDASPWLEVDTSSKGLVVLEGTDRAMSTRGVIRSLMRGSQSERRAGRAVLSSMRLQDRS